jgi:Sec-independent protein translocase protein TatA
MGAMVGPQELVILLVVILGILLITRGPKMLPRIGEALGRTVKTARTDIPSALRDDPEAASGDEPRGPAAT